jgi:uncharacterized protein
VADAPIRIDRVRPGGGPTVSGLVGGGFKVDEGIYRALLITPERADGWEPPALAELTEADLAVLLDLKPEFIVLGTGATLKRPPRSLVAALEARDIGIEPMDSRAAARAWGVLRAEDRWVAGAFYPIDG